MNESILDFPKETLCPKVWTQLDDGSYVLRDEVRATIQTIVDWARSTFKIPEMRVNITGSITSNSYSEQNSDIDVHFNSPRLKTSKADEFNKIFKKAFEDLVVQKPELGTANGIRIEIYMQANPFQDLMSVGCYDFLNNKWLVGPDLLDTDFDPYAEYFMKDLKSVDDIIDGVRSIILQMYELSVGLLKSNDDKFKEQVGRKLHAAMSKASKTFSAIRARRSHKSTPKSVDQAIENRDDIDWKIADSTFKLLDKFGYLKVLRQAADSISNDEPIEDAAKKIIDAITEKISSKSLDDSEIEFVGKLLEVEKYDESMKSMMKMSTIAAIMAIGSFMPTNALAKQLEKAQQISIQQGQPFTKDSQPVKMARELAATDNVMIGEMNKTNVVNAIAKVLWLEARGEGEEGIKAVASVIRNRADGKAKYLIPVIKQRLQFSCLNDYTGGWTDSTYRWFSPSVKELENKNNLAIWDLCKNIALQVVEEKFESTIGNCNQYLNKKKAKKEAIEAWGKHCKLQIGHHSFRYAKEYDPSIVVPGTMKTWKQQRKAKSSKNSHAAKTISITVKKGDTLGTIAKKHGISLSKLMSMNPQITNPDKISVGQKIRIS